jgi:hypothetical protein
MISPSHQMKPLDRENEGRGPSSPEPCLYTELDGVGPINV